MVGVLIDLRDEDEDERLLVPYGSDCLRATNTILLDLAIGIELGRYSVSVRSYRCVFSAIMRLLAREFSRIAFHIVRCVAHS